MRIRKQRYLNLATRRTIAATGVQAVWRSYAVRKDVSRRIAMARRIQRFYRTYCAYVVVRTLVFQRRTGARASWKKQDMAALRIQVWYKHYIKQVRAIADRKGRLERANTFSEERVEREAAAWRRVAGADEDLMAVRLQKFFSGIVWRKREHTRQTTMRARRSASSKIQRCWRWSKASTIKDRKREQRAAQRATRKRIEEVTEATLDMQRIARRFLARLEYHRRVQRGVRRNDAACVLQRVLYILEGSLILAVLSNGSMRQMSSDIAKLFDVCRRPSPHWRHVLLQNRLFRPRLKGVAL